MTIIAQDVLTFWREAGPEKWWRKDPDFDRLIEEKFASLYQKACKGALDHWQEDAEGALALVIVLDQFSRNMFRQNPLAFAQDEKCVAIVKESIKNRHDFSFPDDIGYFFYMPLMHSENLEDQRLCLELMEKTNRQGAIKASQEHLEIIEKFGRFPHRNPVLGRISLPEEQAFLDAGGFAG